MLNYQGAVQSIDYMFRLKISSKHDLDKDLKWELGLLFNQTSWYHPLLATRRQSDLRCLQREPADEQKSGNPGNSSFLGCNENTESCSVHPRMHVQQAAMGFQQMRLMVPSDILCFHVALEAQKCFLRYLSNMLPPTVMCDREVKGSLGMREQKT